MFKIFDLELTIGKNGLCLFLVLWGKNFNLIYQNDPKQFWGIFFSFLLWEKHERKNSFESYENFNNFWLGKPQFSSLFSPIKIGISGKSEVKKLQDLLKRSKIPSADGIGKKWRQLPVPSSTIVKKFLCKFFSLAFFCQLILEKIFYIDNETANFMSTNFGLPLVKRRIGDINFKSFYKFDIAH